jgi:hypothetical protein
MGHLRVGRLPKTKKWRDIVAQIASLPRGNPDVSILVRNTAAGVNSRLDRLEHDSAIRESFSFLLKLAYAGGEANPIEALSQYGIQINGVPTAVKLTRLLREAVEIDRDASPEYTYIALSAAADAIFHWMRKTPEQTEPLFPESRSHELVFNEKLRELATGSEFCDLSRVYFARLTEKYLRYFLEREASSVLGTVEAKQQFDSSLSAYFEQLGRHAFETSKITESFAAGWFNKNCSQGFPRQKQIEAFLSHSFDKLKEELRREAHESE